MTYMERIGRKQTVLSSLIEESNLVLLITLTALAVRVYGISFGLPYVYNSDEAIVVSRAVGFGSGDFNPHGFNYPSLYMYVLFGLYVVYFAVAWLFGSVASVYDFALLFFRDPTWFYLIGRLVAATLGTATVPLVYWLGKKIYSTRVALVAATFMAFAPLHAEFSHYIKTDAPMTFVTTLGLIASWLVYKQGGLKRYLLAGALAGIVTSIMYQGGFVLSSLLGAHILREIADTRKHTKAILLDRNLILSLIACGLAFVAGTPYAVIDWKTFIDDLSGAGAFFTSDVMWNYGWLFLPLSLLNTMGWPLGAVALVGFGYTLWRHRPGDIILAAFCLTLVAFLTALSAKQVHTMNPVFPPLLLAAAVFLVATIDWLILKPAWQSIVLMIVTIAIVAHPAYVSIQQSYTLAQPDTRTKGLAWVQANIPAGTKIIIDSGKYYVSRMNIPLQDCPENVQRRVEDAKKLSWQEEIHWEGMRPRPYREADFFQYQLLAQTGPTYCLMKILHNPSTPDIEMRPLKEYLAEGAQYAVVNVDVYKWYVAGRETDRIFPEKARAYRAFYAFLEQNATLLVEFVGGTVGHPGPTIRIYRLYS